MSNEIKQGDKVRVSEKTPIEYNPQGEYAPLCVINSVVRCVVNDYAMCEPIWADGAIQTPFLIPTKYLVKVDAEAKEPKFKKGDKVRFKKVYTVVSVDDGQVFIDSAGNHIDEDRLELYTEPTEQTEAEKTFGDQIRDVLNGKEHQDYGHPIQTVMANLDRVLHGCDSFVSIKETLRKAYTDTFDWDTYTADLAKEVAVMLVRMHRNDLNKVARMSVDIAKAVVEGLKRK